MSGLLERIKKAFKVLTGQKSREHAMQIKTDTSNIPVPKNIADVHRFETSPQQYHLQQNTGDLSYAVKRFDESSLPNAASAEYALNALDANSINTMLCDQYRRYANDISVQEVL